jgi:hypothetical protein
MEAVTHLLNIINMGFSLPICTMLAGRIALWDRASLIESDNLRLFLRKLLNHPLFDT